MSEQSARPGAWIEGCIQAHRRVEHTLRGLTDSLARRPSLLPGWTVGHVLTHLARNADGHTRMVQAAQRGEVVTQYAGGREERERNIAQGHGRPAAELAADVAAAHARLEEAWAHTGEEVWATGLRKANVGANTIAYAAFLRWREVEVHLADLGLTELGGPTWDGLSPAYIDAEWVEMTAGLARRVPDDLTVLLVPGDRPSRAFGQGERLVTARATAGRLLQWMMGRGGQADWPDLGAW